MSTSPSIKVQVSRARHYMLDLSKYRDNLGLRGSLLVAMSLLLVSVFLIFAIRPTIVKIFELRTQIEESQKTLKLLTAKTNSLVGIANKWETIREKLIFVDNTIPFGTRYRTYNKEVNYLAQQASVTIITMTIGESLIYGERITPYQPNIKMSILPIPVTIRVGGSYSQLVTFMHTLMSLDRLILIDSVTMAPETVTSSSNKYPLTMNLTGTIYYLGDSKTLSPFVGGNDKGKK